MTSVMIDLDVNYNGHLKVNYNGHTHVHKFYIDIERNPNKFDIHIERTPDIKQLVLSTKNLISILTK